MSVLVLGASGNLGSATADDLVRRGAGVRVTSSTADGVARLASRYPDVRELDLLRPATFDDALADVARVFLVRPPAIARVGPTIGAFLDAAEAAGVEHVVFSSVAGAERNVMVPHHRIERHLRDSGMGWTLLRPGFFAQNLDTAYRRDIRDDDRIVVPAGEGRVAFVDTRDIGVLAAAILTEPEPHRGRAYHLTGSEAVTFDEVAAVLTRALGRPISYVPASAAHYIRHLRRQGLPMAQILVQTALHLGLRRGGGAPVTSELGELLGRPPTSLERYVADHRELWASSRRHDAHRTKPTPPGS